MMRSRVAKQVHGLISLSEPALGKNIWIREQYTRFYLWSISMVKISILFDGVSYMCARNNSNGSLILLIVCECATWLHKGSIMVYIRVLGPFIVQLDAAAGLAGSRINQLILVSSMCVVRASIRYVNDDFLTFCIIHASLVIRLFCSMLTSRPHTPWAMPIYASPRQRHRQKSHFEKGLCVCGCVMLTYITIIAVLLEFFGVACVAAADMPAFEENPWQCARIDEWIRNAWHYVCSLGRVMLLKCNPSCCTCNEYLG